LAGDRLSATATDLGEPDERAALSVLAAEVAGALRKVRGPTQDVRRALALAEMLAGMLGGGDEYGSV